MRPIPPEAFAPLTAVYKRGRFREEVNIQLTSGGEHVCVVKIFYGRPPHYSPWAEVFNIAQWFIDSPLEEWLYCLLWRYMDPGDVLYVEYVDDFATYTALRRGVAPRDTRLGKKLTKCGFDVVKDWYFPEGGLEGGMKLQAVKRGVCQASTPSAEF
ncbi:MAG: DUF1122 family protein [Pyrobaculum sp.]